MFPRGGIWMFGVWYVVMYLILVLFAVHSLWFTLVALAVFGFAAAFMITTYGKARVPAFAADGGGIWLGVRNTSRGVRLEWAHVRRIRISAYPHGSILQILLDPGARPTGWGQQIAALALLGLVPMGFRRARPGLLTVLPDPPRYRVQLAQVTPGEVRSGLSALAPVALPIEMRL
jgi:hypothetical protein